MGQATDFDEALESSFTPIAGTPVIQGDVSVTTSPALLFGSTTALATRATRRMRIFNTHLTSTLGVFFLRAGTAATGLVIGNSVKILPGSTFECSLTGDMTMAAIASTGTITANILAHDVF